MEPQVEKARAMVLGTFHMTPGTDMFNIEVDDLLGPKRQKEIRVCVERIKQFRPTKVALEIVTDEDESLNEEYRRYLAGELALGPNEGHQLGFRIAAEQNHPRVYAVDWMERSTLSRGAGDVHDWAKMNQPELFEEIFVPYISEITTEVSATTSILDMLRSCNAPETIKRDHRLYVNLARIGVGKDYVGMGWLRWWYERNLIIYANIARLVESADDRILLIIGGSHIHLVSQFLSESDLFEVESAYAFLSPDLKPGSKGMVV